MKENYNFEDIKFNLKVKNEKNNINVSKNKQSEMLKSMSLKDHWFVLRSSIQEKIDSTELTENEREQVKFLSEIITPELMTEYKQILKKFTKKTKKTDEHPERELIDVDSIENSNDIESWIKNLISEIRTHKTSKFSENDYIELEAQCWLFFDSCASVMNTKSFEKDIKEYYEENINNNTDKKNQKKELLGQIKNRYRLSEKEAQLLVDLIPKPNEDEEYSLRLLIKTISNLWNEYDLGSKKGDFLKISLGYLISKGTQSYAPSLLQNVISDDKFSAAVFIEFLGLNKISQVVETKTNIEFLKIMNDLDKQINERVINSLFFQEFEFIHDKSLGEIFSTLERGKESSKALLTDVISDFAPTLSGTAMSSMFLMKINPLLGSIGIASFPIMWKIAKKQNEELHSMYKDEMMEEEKITDKISSIKSGFEEVKTSSEISNIAEYTKKQLDKKDTIQLQRLTKEFKNRLKMMIPFDISTVISIGVGSALQSAGVISGGEALSNFIYSDQLNRPIQNLVNLYFNRFSRYIQDIERMNEILGKYEEMDLPEGEREKKRISVSTLQNYDISVKDLRYKNILDNVNIDIKQGEFVAIAGASGSGKSTFLKNIVGLYKPDNGVVEIGGISNKEIKKYGNESIYSTMSYSNQSPQYFDGMTLYENLLLWSKTDVNEEKVKQILLDLRLDKFVNRLNDKIDYLSGGERVRIGLARTLIKGAKIMLLDEPTASLDAQSAIEVRKIISELNKKYSDITIIVVTHDEELIEISDRSIEF